MHSFNQDVSAYQVWGTRLAAEDTKMKNSEDYNFTAQWERKMNKGKYPSMYRVLQMFTEEVHLMQNE